MATKQSTRPELTCTKCAALLSSKALFCAECGTPVKMSGGPVTFGPRYAAFLVDVTAILGLWFLSSFVVRPLIRLTGPPEPELNVDNLTGVLSAVIAIILIPLVAFVFHAAYFRRGTSPGMKAVGIKVETLEGSSPGWGRGTLRSLVLWGPLLMMMVGQGIGGLGGPRNLAVASGGFGAASLTIVWIGAMVTAFGRTRRGLHDRLSGTRVVRT